ANSPVIFFQRQVINKGLVDFQFVDLQSLQVAERRIAGTEVINRHEHARIAKRPKPGERRLDVFHDRALGYLDTNHCWCNSMMLDCVENLADNILAPQVKRRQVNRNALKFYARIMPDSCLPARLVKDPLINLDDTTGCFSDGNKDRRRHQSLSRAIPAHQRLDTRKTQARQIHQRLVQQMEFAIFQSLAHRRIQLEAQLRRLSKRRVITARSVTSLYLGIVHGDIGVTQQHISLDAVIRIKRRTDTYAKMQLAT